MRDPAATVMNPALTSPTMTPPSCTSTRVADSILPSSSRPPPRCPRGPGRQMSPGFDVEVAVDADVSLEAARHSHVARTFGSLPDRQLAQSRFSPRSRTSSRSRVETASAGHSRTLGEIRSGGAAGGAATGPAGAGVRFFVPKRHELTLPLTDRYLKRTRLTPRNVIGPCLLLETVLIAGPIPKLLVRAGIPWTIIPPHAKWANSCFNNSSS